MTRLCGSRIALALTCLLALCGCGDRLVDGSFLGDTVLRVRGIYMAPPQVAANAWVGAVWLGYSGLYDRQQGIETRVLPISATEFPTGFVFDVLEAPPSTGHYQTASGFIIPSRLRIARLILFDDGDHDGRFALDGDGLLLPPDRLLGRSEQHVLLFVSQAPADADSLNARAAILTNWQDAFPGYHIVALDPSVASPSLSGRAVDKDTPIPFSFPSSPQNF